MQSSARISLAVGACFIAATAVHCNRGSSEGADATGLAGASGTGGGAAGKGAGGAGGAAGKGTGGAAGDSPGGMMAAGAGGVAQAGNGGMAGQSAVNCSTPLKMKLTLTTRVPIPPFATDEEWMATPLALVQAKGDDRIFIAQRGGRILILRDGKLLPEAFLDMRPSISDVPWGHRGERGLINMALHPDFANNGRFYVYYTGADDDPYSDALDGDVVVAEGTQSSGNRDRANPTLKPLLVAEHSESHPNRYDDGHNGGLLVFGKDGELWVGVGDGGNLDDDFRTGQNPDHPLAKLYRFDVNNIPSNPRTGWKANVWSMGHRNPFRGSVDSETGDLYIGDIQERHWEEINVVPHGTPKGTTNYGWGSTNEDLHRRASCAGQANCPLVWTKSGMEGTHCFPAYFTEADAECEKFGVLPVFEYPHKDTGRLSVPRDGQAPEPVTETTAVMGGFVYRGSKIPGLVGRYIFGDYPNRWIKSFVNMKGKAECLQDHTVDLELATMLKGGIVGFGADAAGELYVLDRDQTHLSGAANKGEGRNIYKLEAE